MPADAVGGVLSWLASEMTGDELLREIEEGSARISELVGAVKAYSHVDRAVVQEARRARGPQEHARHAGPQAQEGRRADTRRTSTRRCRRVCGRASELNQVWTNLIDNAIDAVAGEGTISIRTAREDGRVLVEIADDGPGIPEEVRDRIFEPFFTTKDIGKGTGIGLDISHRVIVEDHKGDIRVLSEPGDTRFQVRLPMRPGGGGQVTTLEELRRVPLFGGLSDEVLEWVLSEGSESAVAAGEVHAREGEPVEDLYVILEGELRVTKNIDGGEMTINVYSAGVVLRRGARCSPARRSSRRAGARATAASSWSRMRRFRRLLDGRTPPSPTPSSRRWPSGSRSCSPSPASASG